MVAGRIRSFLTALTRDVDPIRTQLGGIESRMVKGTDFDQLRGAEFQVFSQWGEDGIIQYLIGKVEVPTMAQRFVEFGVADYRESNSRFLLVHDNWTGLILDGGDAHIRFIEESGLRWRHTIEGRQVFITRENLPGLLDQEGYSGDIGLLSIDLDGNDYWVWQALTDVRARIVVVEYNSIFGPTATVSIPYTSDFRRTAAHPSNLYWGASLAALVHLGNQEGYRFVGSNSAGNNAFFVREDVAGDLRTRASEEEWVESKFRESRDSGGRLSYVSSHRERRSLVGTLPLVDVVTGEYLTVGDLL